MTSIEREGARLSALISRIGPLDEHAMNASRARQDLLTKPQGSLGRLERLATQLAGITGNSRPRLPRKAIIVMAADHGVAREGVSAYPAEVTVQMVRNFASGGAAINAERLGDVPVCSDLEAEHVWDYEGTGDTRTMDVHVRWLRSKIEPDPTTPERLQSVRGVDYVFAG